MRKVKRTENYISLKFRIDGIPMTQQVKNNKYFTGLEWQTIKQKLNLNN